MLGRWNTPVLLVVVAVLAGVILLSPRDIRPSSSTAPAVTAQPSTDNPKPVSAEYLADHLLPFGVVSADKSSVTANITFAFIVAEADKIDRDQLGSCLDEARRFLGTDFEVSFRLNADSRGRPYIRLICSADIPGPASYAPPPARSDDNPPF